MKFTDKYEAVLHTKQALALQGIIEPNALTYLSHQSYFADLRAYNERIDRILAKNMNGRPSRMIPLSKVDK